MFRKFLLTLAGVFAAMLSYAYSPAIRQIKLDVEFDLREAVSIFES